MLLPVSGFYTQKNISKKLSTIWAHALKKIHQPCPLVLCCKNLRNISLKGHQVISLPGAPTCIGLVVASVLTILLFLTILYLYERLAGV
jgi:hypothetical protein